jgi:hypothetical protein
VPFIFPLEPNHQEPPSFWRTFAEGGVKLSEGGAVAMQTCGSYTLTTTGTELTEGKHYWEVELLSEEIGCIMIGISRPNLNPAGIYFRSTNGWFIKAASGSVMGLIHHGNDKEYGDAAGSFKQGDRVGVLLDLNIGSLRFFKNGVQHSRFQAEAGLIAVRPVRQAGRA